MKSFLDRFRRKGSDDEESDRKTESARDLAAEALQKRAAAAGTRPESRAESKTAQKDQPASAEPAPVTPTREETITFTLGDFLSRIPAQLLTTGDHDASVELTFDVAELSARIAKGQTTIPLAEVYQRVPAIFRGEIRVSDNIEIRFPWQKLLELVKSASSSSPQSGLTESAAEALAQKLRTRKRTIGPVSPPAAPTALDRAPSNFPASVRQPNWFSRPAATGAAPATPAAPAEAAPAEAPGKSIPAIQDAASENVLANEIERICQSADQEIARIREEHKKSLLTLEQDNRDLLAERERLRAELEHVRQQPQPAVVPDTDETLRREIQTLQAQLNEHHLLAGTDAEAHEQKLAALRAEADVRDRDLAILRDRLNQVEHTAQTAVQERTALQNEIATLRDGLAAKTQEIQALQKQHDEHQQVAGSEVTTLAQQRDELRAAREAREQELAALRAEADTRDRELAALRDRLGQVEHTTQTVVQERTTIETTLQGEIAALRDTLAAKAQEFQVLQKQHDEQRKTTSSEVAALREQLAKAERAAQTATQERATIETTLRDSLAAKTREAQAFEKQLDEHRQVAGSEITTLSQQRDQLRAEADARNRELATLRDQLGQVEHTTQERTALETTLQGEIAALRDTLAAKAQEVQALQKQHDEQRKTTGLEVAALREQLAKVERAAQATAQERATLETTLRDSLAAKTQEAQALQKQLDEHRQAAGSEVTTLAQQRDELRAAREAREQELAAKAQELQALQKQLDEQRATNTAREQESAALHERLVQVEQTAQAATQERDAQRSTLQAQSQELETLRTESAAHATALAREQGLVTQLQKNAAAGLTAITAERDQFRAAAEARQAELAGLQKRLDQFAQAAKAELSDADAERDRLKAETEILAKSLSGAQSELASLKQAHEAQVQALAQERDALAQQKQHLTEQVVGLQKNDKLRLESHHAEGELYRREAQRQIEESHRRIAALEATQRENAQELTRERETRIKAERTAAAADRARAEAAALVESMRNDAKRDVETSTRKRDAEFARTQKELQDKIDALTDAHSKLKQEHDHLLAEAGSLREAAAAHSDWESRGVASLEADIAGYRERIKVMLKERDALRHERDQLAATHSGGSAEVDALKANHEKLSAEAAALREERDALNARLREFEGAQQQLHAAEQKFATEREAQTRELHETAAATQKLRDECAKLESQLAELTQQRDAGRKRIEKLQVELDELHQRPAVDPAIAAELEQLRTTSRTQIAALEKAKASLEHELAEASQQREAARKRVEKLQAEVEELLARPAVDPSVAETHARELQRIREEAAANVTQLRQELSGLTIAKTALEQNLASMTRDHDSASGRVRALESTLAAKEQELTHAKAELEKSTETIRKERDDLTAELTAARERARTLLSTNAKEHRAALTALTEERDTLQRDNLALAQRIAELRLEVDQKVGQQQQQLDALKAELDKARASFEQQSAAFSSELKTLTEQRDKALAAAESAKRELGDKSRAQVERLADERVARLERDVVRLRRDRDQLIEQRDELRDRIAGMAEAQQNLVKEISLQALKTSPRPTDVVQKAREVRETNVIDITEAEVLQPGEPDTGGVRPPRLRPVVVPPPNLRVL